MSLFYLIDETERTSDVQENTTKKQTNIRRRGDILDFRVFRGTAPSENQEVELFDGAFLQSQTGPTLVLKDSYEIDVNAFREDQVLFLGIGESDVEKGIVQSYDEATRTIILTASPSISLSEDDKIGELIFGGTITRVQDWNPRTFEDIQFDVQCGDYTKIFDKKLVNDSWEDADARYIINDFTNTTVNLNQTIDDLSFDTNGEIQGEWIESGDGDNPIIDTINFVEQTSSGVFSWTNSSGTATWEATPSSRNVSELVGVSSGAPTKGSLMIWPQTSNQSDITAFKLRYGSDSSNYAEVTVTLTSSTDFQYTNTDLDTASITGTPDWTAADYAAIVVDQTASGTIKLNGFRLNANNSFTLFNVQTTTPYDTFRAPRVNASSIIEQIANQFSYIWYIDYERDIHFVPDENDPAPFNITETSNNFTDIRIEVDTANLGNRVTVEGGEKTSISVFAQVFEGDGVLREWLAKNKFRNLVVTIDDNTSTDTMEGGTTSTTVVATGHGLAVGDHIVNRTRSNALRQILTVPGANSFTVEAVTSQASGDTFSKFDTTPTLGIEGITDETTVDYVQNSNEKSVRATTNTDTLFTGTFIRFAYNERIPIIVQVQNSASVNSLRGLGIGDGIFDIDTIVDRNIETTLQAVSIAEAKLNEFSNAVITGRFNTDQKGLRSGQLIEVILTTDRSIDDTFVVQKVQSTQRDGRFKDYFIFRVSFATTLFGWIEFIQKILEQKQGIEFNEDAVIEHISSANEVVELVEASQAVTGGILTASSAETVESADVNTVVETTPPWEWEPNGGGQTLNTRYNLFEWG